MASGYALLIGVNDYSAYDASIDRPKGTSDLHGSLNDVRAWIELCLALGYPRENIRVLSSPELPAASLHGIHQAPATAAEIRQGVTWLAENLGKHRDVAGVLTFSGHGDQTGTGLVICPVDTIAKGGELLDVVGLAEMQAIVAAHHASPNLTVVLDCCHSGAASAGSARKSLALRDHGVAITALSVPPIGDRVLFAAALGQQAYQAEFPGGIHGAFTWAFMSTKDQWKIDGEAGRRVVTIAYAEMQCRTAALLDALSFGQTPALRCAPGADALPLFNPGPVAPPGETTPEPNGPRTVMQCDPGFQDYRLYTFQQYVNGSWSVFGKMIVPRTSSTTYGFTTGTEYWQLTTNPTSALEMYVSWVDYTWSSAPPFNASGASFVMTQEATWTQTTAPRQASTLFITSPSYNSGIGTVGLNWSLAYFNGIWSGSLTWYSPTGSNTVFGGLGVSYMYLNANIAAPTYWFTTTLGPR